jgi:2Fe-2S ferredoxin
VRREIDPKVSQKLSKIGIDEALHEEVVSNLACVFGNNISISTLDSFGNEGLKALAESIKNQRPSMGRRKKKEILISIPHHKTEFTTTWTQGESFMQLAHDHEVLREYIEASCGGTMACCSCHIYLDENTYQALGGRPSVDERDMLDLAHEYRRGASRLGCQVQLTDELYDMDHQIVVTIPSGVNNVWN